MSQSVPRKQNLLIAAIVIVAFLICATGGVVAILVGKISDFGEAAGEVDSAAREYRATGWPWVAKDLRPEIPIPADKNAAQPIRKAFKLLGDHEPFITKFTQVQQLVDANKTAAAAIALIHFDPALNAAVSASTLPDLDFTRDADLGPSLLFPEDARIKDLARGLCLRAQVEAQRSGGGDTARDLKAAWNLGVLTAREPYLIDMMVGISVHAMVLNAIPRCAYSLRDNSDAIKQLQGVVAAARPFDFAYALRGEAYMGVATIRNLKAFGGVSGVIDGDSTPPIDPKTLIRSGLPADTVSRAFLARHLQVWTRVKKEIDRCGPDMMKLSVAMDKIQEDLESKKTASNILNLVLFPVFSQTVLADVRSDAELQATRAVLQGLQVRLRTGKLPKSIDEIPGVWIDPFNGKPLKVRQEGDSFRVYSVGPNLKDDGGVFRSELEDRSSEDFDVGSVYPHPIKPKTKDPDKP